MNIPKFFANFLILTLIILLSSNLILAMNSSDKEDELSSTGKKGASTKSKNTAVKKRLSRTFSTSAMKNDDQALNKRSKFLSHDRVSNFPINLPVEIQAHILSFLDQRDLLRAGGMSKSWRQAAERVWKNKPLGLSNRRLSQNDYEALIHGVFSSLILRSVELGKEEACILALSLRLKHLDLSHNSIGAEGAKGIASGNLHALTALYLSYNSIGAEGAKGIASGNLAALTSLDLNGNSIRAEGAKGIASGNLTALTSLDLSGNSIRAEGAKGIASGNLHALTALHLSYNSIGDEGRKALAKNIRLNVIY